MRPSTRQALADLQATVAAVPQVVAQAVAGNNNSFVTPALQAQFESIVGGSSPQGRATLLELMNHLASDETAAAALLAQQNADRARIATAEANLATTAQALLTKAPASVVTALQGTVDTHTAAIASKLSKAGDVATGPIMVPAAAVATAAPNFGQTFGGLNSPVRYAYGVGAAAVALGPGPLTDPTPLGRRAKPYQVILTMRTAPAVGATITVGTTAAGADVFTKTYLLAALPGVGALLAPLQPLLIDVPAGTTLYAKATAGTWDVEVFSYYKS